jgi:hypothetical protein
VQAGNLDQEKVSEGKEGDEHSTTRRVPEPEESSDQVRKKKAWKSRANQKMKIVGCSS